MVFFWPRIRDSVRDWVGGYLVCAKQKEPNKTKRAPLKQAISGVPVERVAIDITGPFPTTEAGNKYVVVISDYAINNCRNHNQCLRQGVHMSFRRTKNPAQ